MRNLLFYFLILVLNEASAQTNVYHPFPASNNAMWRVDWGDGNFCHTLDRIYQYYYDGDTVININTYHKISKSGIIIGWCYTGTSFGYQGALREDTTARKVYLVLPGTSNDSLLYDFSLNIGDTLRSLLLTTIFVCSNSTYTDTVIVTSIDSILVGNFYRKRWNFDQNPNLNCMFFPIIEGIGSVLGLIEDLGAFEQGGTLVCFTTDSLTFSNYQSPYGCNFIDDVPDLNEHKYFESSPNPFSAELNINFPNPQKGIAFLKIYNSLGETVLEKQIHLEGQTLNLSALPKGIFLVSIRSEERFWTQKLLK